MKRSRLVLIGGMAMGGVLAVVYAGGQFISRPPGSSLLAPESQEIAGIVESLDRVSVPAKLALRTAEKGIVEISVDPKETAVLEGGKVFPLDEIVKGQRVKAFYKMKDGKEVATSIVVQRPPVSFPPPPSSKPPLEE